VRGSATGGVGPLDFNGFRRTTKEFRTAAIPGFFPQTAEGIIALPISPRVTCTSGSGSYTLEVITGMPKGGDVTVTYYDENPIGVTAAPVNANGLGWFGFAPFTASFFPANANITTSKSKSTSVNITQTETLYGKVSHASRFNSISLRIRWSDNGVNRSRTISTSVTAVYDATSWIDEAYVMAVTLKGEFTTNMVSIGLGTVRAYYFSNNSYQTSSGTRYGLMRHADVIGMAYWAWYSVVSNKSLGSVAFNDDFFGAITPNNGDYVPSISPSKTFRQGAFVYINFLSFTGFWDRPC
jgi:hypothetical protein